MTQASQNWRGLTLTRTEVYLVHDVNEPTATSTTDPKYPGETTYRWQSLKNQSNPG